MSSTRLVLEVVRWAIGFWLLWRAPAPGGRWAATATRAGDPGDLALAGTFAVVIPARDEAASLPNLLASLAAQSSPPGEVVVVDDHSGDATAPLARAAGVRVIESPDLPDGWTGKTWACANGAAATSAERLLFLDADVVLGPDAIARIGAELHAGGLVSVQPWHTMGRPTERLSAFFNIVGLMGVDAFSPRRGRVRPTGAFGPVMACSRADYDTVGTHAAVRSEVLEDAALCRRFLGAGLPVRLFAGREVVHFRMYPGGLRQLVEGWTKIVAGGAAGTRPLTLVLVVAWLSGCIMSVQFLAVYLAYVVQLLVLQRRVGRFGLLSALAYPLTLVFFLAIFVRSLVLIFLRHEVTWKGRRVATGRGR